ncbi:preprotein translocase subunit SecE [Thermodesulfobium acidiphilum]|uniref:Protein translocase subunit SecE n=1 Tax=Thermodesulfobium acidiphilum TaxID=1794699 RepID=A0A2R4VZD7_THEAF|nr:preprotein translocase subunit SecE [Thermodesulfobium acidiphilum]AWB09895.1 preprotein translocase subunit SecE [Thermodesulfobium acidiphilum]
MLSFSNIKEKIVSFYSEVKVEARKVSWPDRKTVISATGVVLAFSLIVAAFVGAIDAIFTAIFNFLISTFGHWTSL